VFENKVPRLNAPIVLAHGLCGFDCLGALGWRVKDYFPGIPEKLAAAGNRVLVARVSKTQGVAYRAAELKCFIERNVPTGPVHIIGHSMGGLDARYMISRLGMARRVRSLTTVATPHRGSAVADFGLKRVAPLLTPFFHAAGISTQGFRDLSTWSCQRFNADVPDMPGVRYFSVAGVCEKPWVGPEWQLQHQIMSNAEGPNDGVVSVASARWGEHTDVWKGDHLNLVNWPNRLARKRGMWESLAPDYGRILRRIAGTA
jgi:triacylglycerol lipase